MLCLETVCRDFIILGFVLGGGGGVGWGGGGGFFF